MISTRLRALALVLATAGNASAGGAAPVELGGELARLAAQHGFSVTGDEHLADGVGRAEGDDLLSRLRILLEGFDHIIVQDGRGGIERVIVLGATEPGVAPPQPLVAVDGAAPPDAPIELPTIRQGAQHAVRIALEGVAGERVARELLVDTGADTVVLPMSMIEALGMDRNALQEREVQTANGRTRAQTGQLPAVWLGPWRVADVAVAFLDDDRLGSTGLLGMSVLGRYQLTIDDQQNLLRLTDR
jgi:clan AA aspartic protease (TIGR02281 family)